MHYRLYLPADFPKLYTIEELCFQPPFRFSRRYMHQIIESHASATWIAEGEENEMTGFAIVEWPGHSLECRAYIQTLEVAPEHRRRGIAGELLRRLESSARQAGANEIWLHVDAENAAAIRLYRAHGYQQQGREEHYYARQRAAEVYAKLLAATGE